MSDKQKKKEDGELSGEEDEYKSPKQKKSDKDDRKKPKRSSRSHSSRRTSDKINDSTKSSKKEKDHKDSSRRRSKSRSKDRKDQLKRKYSRSRSRSYQNDRNGTNPKKDRERDNAKEKDRKRSKSPTKDKDRKNDRKRSKSPRSSNNGKRKSSRSKSPKRDDSRRDKDQKPSNRDNEKRSNYSSNRDRESRRSEENNTREGKQLTLEEEEERNDRYYNEFDDSDSDYYQRVNDRKYKSSRRSKSRSKNRDRKRSKSKGRKDDKNKDKDKDKEKSKNSGNGDNSKSSKDKKEEEAKKVQQPEPVDDDEDLNMEIEDSDDERERKKQEFLNMIKVKGMEIQKQEASQTLSKENNQNNSSSNKNDQDIDDKLKTKDQDNLDNQNFADENSDEQLFDDTGLNPNDVLDDDDVNIANTINDDYKEEVDESHSLTHRHSIDKAQLDHLKYLEDMRNQEIKGGIPDMPEQPVIKQKRKSVNSEILERKFSNNEDKFDEFDEENKLHKLDDQEDEEEETDMFGDDIDKIINKSNDGKLQVVKGANAECDDEQNYFKILIGEVLNGKYRVVQKCGKGVFANVCKAEQLDNGKMVAIKILRSNEIMRDSGEREKEIIQKLNLNDKNDRKHIVRLKNVFEHQKHMCLVFECFAMNLRDALKEYGKGKGFSLDVVRSYAYQIFVALTHLKKNNYIHADLKPDNLLISEDTKTLKMCDFGTALPIEENGIIKYLQSRFYRAPEVLIGYPPYNQIDVWSIGVTLYEIYTQKILFDGSTNNEMLKLIMDSRGKFNKKMLQNGKYVEEYFDQNYNFKYTYLDKQTNQKYTNIITYGDIPKKDIYKLLQENKDGINLENQKKLSQFKDFLDKCLQLDPKNRITPEEALEHPFLKLNTTNPTKPK